MPNLPNLMPIVWLALVGLAAVAIGGLWLTYHVAKALLLYIGAI